jgi:hypothetical protein
MFQNVHTIATSPLKNNRQGILSKNRSGAVHEIPIGE